MLFDDINKQNKYYQVWKDILKIINREHGELKLHEKTMIMIMIMSMIMIYL